ncbi:two-component system sensor histidine kinase NtrB [Desulforhopalus singaporensis]|uniref:histidine kinase n=1 Tax=Desulforhopalus singaporensis TaxID=91360 RepID=A0A1H0U2A8_9BACT|nr:ATP-binding protein [Desulforhopalus singaporensis]SDP60135.1 PAS domain S-box-containing protein [Desulforhopalus singaporensis]
MENSHHPARNNAPVVDLSPDKSRKNRSIARRLTLGLMLTVAMVSFIVVAVIYMYEVKKAKTDLETRADNILSYQIRALEIPLWNIDYDYIKMIGKTISQNEPIAHIIIKDHFGRVAYSMEKKDLERSVYRSGTIYHNGAYVGEVALSLSIRFYQKDNEKLLFSFILIIFIILITIVIFSGLFIHLILKRPLSSLNQIVQAYAQEKYDYTLPDYRPYVEFQAFSSVLEQMGTRINEQLKKLQSAEEKYRNIFENAIEGIFQSTHQGRFISINPAMAHMMGYDSPEEVLASYYNIRTDFYVKPEDRILLTGLLEKNDRVFEFETKVHRKDGNQITVAISARNVRDSEGTPLYYEGFMRDITEEKRLQKQAEHRLQQVLHADKLASLGEVVAGVAHEINNPNSFITCNVPLLEETWQILKPLLDHDARQNPEKLHSGMTLTELCLDMEEIIGAIRSGSERINKIVVNLKDFVRIDTRREPEPVNLNLVIEKTFAIIGTQVRKSVNSSRIDVADNLPMVMGYFQKFEQIVTNLVLNAINAIDDKDKGRIVVRTGYDSEHRRVVLQVEDNGCGMEPKVVDRIFEPFFTTRRNEGGTGLGLSVSYNLAKENNGIVGVLSKPGTGTCFTLFFSEESTSGLQKEELRPTLLYAGNNDRILKSLKANLKESADMALAVLGDADDIFAIIKKRPEIDIIFLSFTRLEPEQWQLIWRITNTFPLLTLIVYSRYPEAIELKPPDMPAPEYLLFEPFRFKTIENIIDNATRLKL